MRVRRRTGIVLRSAAVFGSTSRGAGRSAGVTIRADTRSTGVLSPFQPAHGVNPMIRNLVRVVSLGLALAACSNITSNGATEIRVANRSGRDFDRVTVQ